MVMLATLEQTKLRLRADHGVEDEDLELAIAGASAAVLNYLKLPHDTYSDSSGEVPVNSSGTIGVPAEVVNAVLMLVGILSRDRDGQEMEKWQHGYLPMPVIALLYPLRDPSLA
jgi:hypothetical protein